MPRHGDTYWPFQDVFDSFFDRMMRHWAGPLAPERGGLRFWDFDVSENEKELVVRAELPGFEPDDIDIRANDNSLTIQAEKKSEGEQEEAYRSFYRSVTLPAGIDTEKVQASYRNGVLELHLPRSEEAQPRRIKVQGHQALTGEQPAAAGQETSQQPSEASANASNAAQAAKTKGK